MRSSNYGRPNPAYGSSGLAAVEPLWTQGYKDGRHSWIDVRPPRGPAMRITHTIGADLTRPPSFNGLGELGVLPAVPVATYGLAAAGAAGAIIWAWLTADDSEWNSPEYFDQAMAWLHSTLLAWDKESWVNDRCKWRGVYATQRKQWVDFLNAFGKFYAEVGQTRSSYTAWVGAGVRDRYIPAAKTFMRQLKDVWIPFFEKNCGFTPTGAGAVPSESAPATSLERVVMWSALAIGAVALASVVRTLK